MNTSNFLAFLFSLTIGVITYKRNSITKSGFITLIIISSLFIISDELELLMIIFCMFASSSLLSKIFPHDKETLKVIAKYGARDYIQALANLGVATFLFLIYILTNNQVYIIGMIASVISANADSWASEIGSVSKKTPRMITTFKQVKKGVSGGITALGTLGGILGGLFILISSYLTLTNNKLHLLFTVNGLTAMFVGGISGLFIDSYLGAQFQALYSTENSLTEKNTGNLIKGIKWMDNDMVNFLSTLSAALISMLISCFI
jgi:uncharacterized protein (TIGR00297 family)